MPGRTSRKSSISAGLRPGSRSLSAALRSGADTTVFRAARPSSLGAAVAGAGGGAGDQGLLGRRRFRRIGESGGGDQQRKELAHGEPPLGARILLDPAFAAILAALPGPGQDLPAGRRTDLVDRAGDAAAELALESYAALIPPAELHVALAFAVEHGQPAEQARVARERRAGPDLDVVDIPLGAVLVGVAAAGATGLAVERHADSFARAGPARDGICSTSAGVRPSMRNARAAAQKRAPAPTRNSACEATSG